MLSNDYSGRYALEDKLFYCHIQYTQIKFIISVGSPIRKTAV
jgi:hypothetical protein